MYLNQKLNRAKVLKRRERLRNPKRSEVGGKEERVGRNHVIKDTKEGVNHLVSLKGDLEIDLAHAEGGVVQGQMTGKREAKIRKSHVKIKNLDHQIKNQDVEAISKANRVINKLNRKNHTNQA